MNKLQDMYKLSIYSLIFQQGTKFYLYNSRANFFSEISEEFYNILQNETWDVLPKEVLARLKSKEVIVERGKEFDFYYSELIRFNIKNYNPCRLNLVIAPTTACNFNCYYCFEPKMQPKTINDDTINKLGEFIKSHEDVKELYITWYGGEPLLAFDKIKKIYSKLLQDGMPEIKKQSIITNGYCFDDKVIDFFSTQKLDSIQISFDGIKYHHDNIRCVRETNEPTFDRILGNIEKIANKLTKTRIDIRVNINKANYTDFAEIHKLIAEKFPGNKMICAYPGIIREETEDGRSLCSLSYKPSELMDLYQTFDKMGINSSIFPRRKFKGCMIHSMNAYIIGPEGEIYKCWNDVSDPDKIIGNISSKDLIGSSRFIKFATQARPFNEECRNCLVFPICDGGCGLHRYRNMFEDCNYELCSPYKDVEKLKTALLTGTL